MYSIVVHILCTVCADIEGEDYSPDTFEFWLEHCYHDSVVNICCFNWLVWTKLRTLPFSCNSNRRHWSRTRLLLVEISLYTNMQQGVLFSSFQVTCCDIYVLWAQDLVIMFPSFCIKEFHYICLKRLFERYENFHLLVNIRVHNFSLCCQAIRKSST